MIDKQAPAFTKLCEFASSGAGGRVVFATDDFFAPCENMILDSDPVNLPDKYTEFGKYMDGWETRRKRIPGHDWCIIKLSTLCVIRGLLVDTAFFTGNNAPKYSIQAACLSDEEEESIPPRDNRIDRTGTASSEYELQEIKSVRSEEWDEIVPITALRPGYDDTRLNFQKVLSDEAYSHIRVNIYPDGGIARLRVYGEARPQPPLPGKAIDLMSMMNGGTFKGSSNAFYSQPQNIIKVCKSLNMSDGWETARRADRPEIIKENEDGTLNIPGEEFAVFKLGFLGRIHRICVDTAHFKGNYPDTVKIEGAFLGKSEWSANRPVSWNNILKPSKLSADKEHWFDCSSNVVNHVKVTIAPDGGIARVRAYGYVESNNII